jgi:hypothetical protein
MTLHSKAQVYLNQPPPNSYVNVGSQLCPKVGVWLGSDPTLNLITGVRSPWVGTAHSAQYGARTGKATRTTAIGNYVNVGDLSAQFGNGEGTLLVVIGSGSQGASFGLNCPAYVSTYTTYYDELPFFSDSKAEIAAFAAERWITATLLPKTISDGTVYSVQARTNEFRAALDGLTIGTSGATTFTAPNAIKLLGASINSGAAFTRGASLIAIDNRRWSDSEINEFVRNPWQIFQPLEHKTRFRVWQFTGNINESLAITDWRISAQRASDGAYMGTATSGGSTYTVNVTDTAPCVVTIHPKIDYAWSASKVVALGDLCVPSNPEATHKIYEATDIGSAPHQTHSTTEPTWPSSGTVSDNDITWTYVADLVDPISIGPKIPS